MRYYLDSIRCRHGGYYVERWCWDFGSLRPAARSVLIGQATARLDMYRNPFIPELQISNPIVITLILITATNPHRRNIQAFFLNGAIVPKSVDWNRIADRQKIAPFGTISCGRLRGLPAHSIMDTKKDFAARVFLPTVSSTYAA
jgi:hypothetical protein